MKNTRLYDHLAKFSLTNLKLIQDENSDYREDHVIDALEDASKKSKDELKRFTTAILKGYNGLPNDEERAAFVREWKDKHVILEDELEL